MKRKKEYGPADWSSATALVAIYVVGAVAFMVLMPMNSSAQVQAEMEEGVLRLEEIVIVVRPDESPKTQAVSGYDDNALQDVVLRRVLGLHKGHCAFANGPVPQNRLPGALFMQRPWPYQMVLSFD